MERIVGDLEEGKKIMEKLKELGLLVASDVEEKKNDEIEKNTSLCCL